VKRKEDMKKNSFMNIVFAILVILATSGCGQMVGDSNFIVENGETVPGSLWALSSNIELEEGSTVEGSVLLLCCNIMVDGRVDGDILLLTGNIQLGRNADVNGRVNVLTGNISQPDC
jgi:cytoskeletal protein CcmA (bactofilin family)